MIRPDAAAGGTRPRRAPGGIRTAGLIFIFLAGAACASNTRRSVVTEPLKTYYAGHYKFELPETLRRDPDEIAKVRGLRIRSVTLPPAQTGEQSRKAFWKKYLDDLREKPRGYDEPRVIQEDEVRPGTPRVLYRGGHRLDRVVEVLLADDSHGVLIKTEWSNYGDEAEHTSAGPDARRVLTEVLAAHRFLPPGYAPADPAWFYLPAGAIALPYSASDGGGEENLEILFLDAGKERKFSLESVYPWQGRDSSKPGFMARVAQTIGGWALGMRSIRTGHRTVAGFAGEEALLRSKTEDGEKLMFGWVYEPPENAPGFQPKIVIELEAPATDLDGTLALWDQALDRIKRISRD